MRRVSLNGEVIEAKSDLHYHKLLALKHYLSALLESPVGHNVASVVLYGGVAAGEVTSDSDIDVLVFAVAGLPETEQVSSDLAYHVLLDTTERVEAFVKPVSDFAGPHSYFVDEALRLGKVIYTMQPEATRYHVAQNYFWLASGYLDSARLLHTSEQLRGTIDLAYNAAELCAKAFLVGRVKRMPTRHSRVIGTFSHIYIVQDQKVPPEVGRQLNRGLDWRNKARYEYEAEITADMATKMLALADRLLELLREHLKELYGEGLELEDEQENNS